jgi:hypothetical protein
MTPTSAHWFEHGLALFGIITITLAFVFRLGTPHCFANEPNANPLEF